jgi:hypothetical protein
MAWLCGATHGSSRRAQGRAACALPAVSATANQRANRIPVLRVGRRLAEPYFRAARPSRSALTPDRDLAVLSRVRLRRIDAADAPAIFTVYSHEEGTRFLARPPMVDPVQADEMVARIEAGYADGSTLQLAIERNSDAAFLGVCLLFNMVARGARGEKSDSAIYGLLRSDWT